MRKYYFFCLKHCFLVIWAKFAKIKALNRPIKEYKYAKNMLIIKPNILGTYTYQDYMI